MRIRPERQIDKLSALGKRLQYPLSHVSHESPISNMNVLLKHPLFTPFLRHVQGATMLRTFSYSARARSPKATAALVGVAAALEAAKNVSSPRKPRLFETFSLADRVAVISGGNRGLGLEMALALAEAGARVYALDLPPSPGEEFRAVQAYVRAFGTGARLEYVDGGVDVTDQKRVWGRVAEIGDKEGRVDVGVAAAGILHGAPSLEYDAEDFQKVSETCQIVGS